jgi:hypothetical protein
MNRINDPAADGSAVADAPVVGAAAAPTSSSTSLVDLLDGPGTSGSQSALSRSADGFGGMFADMNINRSTGAAVTAPGSSAGLFSGMSLASSSPVTPSQVAPTSSGLLLDGLSASPASTARGTTSATVVDDVLGLATTQSVPVMGSTAPVFVPTPAANRYAALAELSGLSSSAESPATAPIMTPSSTLSGSGSSLFGNMTVNTTGASGSGLRQSAGADLDLLLMDGPAKTSIAPTGGFMGMSGSAGSGMGSAGTMQGGLLSGMSVRPAPVLTPTAVMIPTTVQRASVPVTPTNSSAGSSSFGFMTGQSADTFGFISDTVKQEARKS